MLRRAVVIVVLGLGLMAGLRPEAEGHAAGTIRGIHYSSVTCVDEVQGIPQPDPDDPEFFVKCIVTGQEIEVLCENPAGHDVAPGTAATQIIVESQEPIEPSDFIADKKVKGRALKAVEVSTEGFLSDEFCVNPNWNAIAVLVTRLQAVVEVLQCVSNCGSVNPMPTFVKTSTETVNCELPSQYSVVNPPPSGEPTDENKYVCVTVPGSKQHLR